ncbi:MAG: universal stress protein [Nitrospirota bacterium]
MKKSITDLKILLPIDGSEHSARAVRFCGYFGAALGKRLKGVSLLRVITGRYMRDRIPFFDFRAEILKQSETFKRHKQRYVETEIMPSLEKAERILGELGIPKTEKLVADGDPAKEIVRIADDRNFSTIIMAKRGLSEIAGIFLGSVTNKVVHSLRRQTVYVVGQRLHADQRCPIPRILIPVDGSSYSMKGVKHGVFLAQELKDFIAKITLLRVVNLAFYETRLLQGIDLAEETEKILQDAKREFLKGGLTEKIVSTKIRVGEPSEEILKEAEEAYDLIIIGRKGRTALKDFVLGGVSTTVMQRCQNPTLAIVSSE